MKLVCLRFNLNFLGDLFLLMIFLQTKRAVMKNGWLIKTSSKSFAVYAGSPSEKAEWIRHIKKCANDLLEQSEVYKFLYLIDFTNENYILSTNISRSKCDF